MRTRPNPDLAKLLRDRSVFDEALREAAQTAVRLHRQTGVPMATWDNGQAVLVNADDVQVDNTVVAATDRIAS